MRTAGAAVGLDIGTSFGRAALVSQGQQRPELVADGYGRIYQPAVVRYTLGGPEVGYYPARFLVTNWENSVTEVTRFIGRWRDLPREVVENAPFMVYEREGQAQFNLLYGLATPEEIYTRIALHLVEQASRQGEQPVREVVVTVPASAEDFYRVRVREALEAAGLRVLKVMSQPTAALLALRHLGRVQAGQVLIVDVGGGTTDVSVAQVEQNGGVTVQATVGDAYLGGQDFGRRLAEVLAGRFYEAEGGGKSFAEALVASRSLSLGLLHTAEEAMTELSRTEAVELAIDHGAGFGRDLYTRLTRREFEKALEDYLLKICELCHRALSEAHLQAHELDAIVMVGGASQIPAVRKVVAAALGRHEAELICYEPQGLAALGAAVQAAALQGFAGFAGLQVRDVTPYPLGIAAYINTGQSLADERGEEELLSVIIDRQSRLPVRQQRSYYTRYPNQTEMELRVLQYRGDKQARSHHYYPKVYPQDCETLGKWTLTNIKPRLKSEVLVTFEIDENGIFSLTAQEKGTRNCLTQQIERW
jgi:molecular chaperone DnaK (HSP70)